MKVSESTAEHASGALVNDRRFPLRDGQTATPFLISGVLRCPDWQADIPAQLINYHFCGACVWIEPTDHRWIDPVDHPSIIFDFHLGRQRLKCGIPTRVAWEQFSSSGLLGIEFLTHCHGFVDRALRYLCHPNIAPQIKAPDPLDINRHVYFRVVNVSRGGMLLSTSLTNKHLVPGLCLEPADLFVPGAACLPVCLRIESAHVTPAQDYLYLGVSIQDKSPEYQQVMARYLSNMSPDILSGSKGQKGFLARSICLKRLKSSLTALGKKLKARW